MLDIVSFNMSSDRYFCFSLNIIELHSRMKLSCLETIWLFQVLVLIFVPQDRSSVHSQVNGSHDRGENLLCGLLDDLWVLRFSSWAGRNRHYLGLYVSVRHYYFCSLQVVLSPDSGGFLPAGADQHSSECLRGRSIQMQSILSVPHSLLLYSYLQTWTSHSWLSLSSPPLPDWRLSGDY